MIPTENGHLKIKQITCTCSICLDGNYADCHGLANHHVSHKMLHEHKPKLNCKNNVDDDSGVEEIVYPGTVLALYTDDRRDSFYMVQCVNAATILDGPKSDAWGNSFERGSHVIEGLYYNKTSRDGYRLIPYRHVLFPVLSVMYVIATTPSKNGCVILGKQTKTTIESLVREIRTANQSS